MGQFAIKSGSVWAAAYSDNPSLVFQDDPSGSQSIVVNGTKFYTSVNITDPEGRALIRHSNGESIWFERVLSRLDTQFTEFAALADADVGARIESPDGYEASVGYIRQTMGRAFDPTAYLDPFVAGFEPAKLGAIIPVNARNDDRELEVWWYKKVLPPPGMDLQPSYWPSSVRRYSLKWPDSPDKIVLASNKGTDDLPSLQATGRIYYQNNSGAPGFNPNDEHALMLNGRAWALRDDLGTADTSLPYVLVRYTEADSRPAMRVFKVQREDLDADPPIRFSYPAVAGKVLQAPMPIPLLSPIYIGGALANEEVAPTRVSAPANSSTPQHYNKYTFSDRKGTKWVYRGPHTNETSPSFHMKYYYPSQDGFYLPGAGTQPVANTPMPYLRNAGASPTGSDAAGVKHQALAINFIPEWPAFAPVLNLGETLTLPTRGLPAIRGQTSVDVIYEQAFADSADGNSVTLFDPTVAKVSGFEAAGLDTIPDSVKTSVYQGKTYFPNLPPHLVDRFFFDPNIGAKGSVVLIGKFIDAPLGEDYLLLNTLTKKDVADLKGLCLKTDAHSTAWEALVDGLTVLMQKYVENAKKPGTYIPAAPDAALTIKINKVWTYINGVAWRNQPSPPTASELQTGSSVSAPNGELDNALEWIKAHFSDLVGWDKVKQTIAPTEEQDALNSRFESHMAITDPEKDKGYPRPPNTYYNKNSSRLSDATSRWNTYDEKVAYKNKLKEWIMAMDTTTKTSLRKWSSDGRALIYNDLLATTLTVTAHGQSFTVPSTQKEKAWKFVETYRTLLEKWDGVAGAPTPASQTGTDLKADYTKSEQQSAVSVDGVTLPEVTNSDIPVDSYALTADGGKGWVTVIVGNGRVTTPNAEPVSMYVMRVAAPLGRGELKIIQPSNPLSEKLTLQSSLDFAAKPEAYEFQWRTLPPVDGQPPVLYTFTRNEVVGDDTWYVQTADGSVTAKGLPAQIQINSNNPASAVTSMSRSFSLTNRPFRMFASVDLGNLDGVKIYVNGVSVAQKNFLGETDTAVAAKPLPSFQPLRFLYEVPVSLLITGTNTVSMELVSTADPNSSTVINLHLESMTETDLSSTWNTVGPLAYEAADAAAAVSSGAVVGKNRHVIEGNSLFTLTDNYFICRYRALNSSHAGYVAPGAGGGWSKWTEPQLAEGWIKRVLAGINPFQQRITDLYNNNVNTDVSLVSQAGKRWEGDIPLNLANINDFGLIEIYETVLRRGKNLSIDGTPAINYGGANDALLLAAGYLSDLYMILGNEAYADAANPTIAFNTNSGTFGDVATSLFAFKGQVASVLDEELGLLRGRDDFLVPDTHTSPLYNRMVWNYTRGIDSGEAIYALNYNIKDLNNDGVIAAADAVKAYPQGHGDAYGHYLTALTGYYSLLWNPNFSWTPRIEAVTILDKPVSVDYLDERKFATAAAAWTRTAAQLVDLTYRSAYVPVDPSSTTRRTWQNLKDGRVNDRTGNTRRWGVDDWAVRGGQGSYFHWLTGNSMVPEEDPNPNHEGIQKIDRTTIPEFADIVAQSEAIQGSLDKANAGLNPLGLSNGAVPFDISPTDVDKGKTHYEQVYERATTSLTNAVASFNRAKSVTQLLRDQDESLAAKREAIFAQERSFEGQLVDLYGTPYSDDIGPGKTYPQNYTGPDLLHYMYVEMPELFENNTDADLSEQRFQLAASTDFAQALTNIDKWGGTEVITDPVKLLRQEPLDPFPATGNGIGQIISYTLDGNGNIRRPKAWTGRRAIPGKIQQAVSEAQMARLKFGNALGTYQNFAQDFRRASRNYKAVVLAHLAERQRMVDWNTQAGVLEAVITSLDIVDSLLQDTVKEAESVADAAKEAPPKVVGVANDATSAVRSAIAVANATSKTFQFGISQILGIAKAGVSTALSNLDRATQLKSFDIAWNAQHLQLVSDLKLTFRNLENQNLSVDTAARAFNDANDSVRALSAEGDGIQSERTVYRKQAAALIQGYRTKDFGFRAFRNEALESYKSLFDLAARYTFLAARAYDYETGLVDSGSSAAAQKFYQSIVRARAVGVFANGVPQQAGSQGGDPGLSGALARMNSDWAVAKSRFGFNNPDRYQTTFSLRREDQRIIDGTDGDLAWKHYLASCRKNNILDDDDVRRHCLNANSGGDLMVPGFIIPFESTIASGFNFFGRPLAGGDSNFSPTSFATKVRSAGIAFKGYIGMASPSSIGGTLTGTGATSPSDPGTGFSDPDSLSATPYIYVIAAGEDSMRVPSSPDSNLVRTWQIEDQAIPLPFDVGGAFSSSTVLTSGQTLADTFVLRKNQAFRAVPGGTVFSSAPGFTNSRLIGRSVWNSRWKIVIPGNTLLANPTNGMAKFLDQVKDILIHFETYSYSGN